MASFYSGNPTYRMGLPGCGAALEDIISECLTVVFVIDVIDLTNYSLPLQPHKDLLEISLTNEITELY